MNIIGESTSKNIDKYIKNDIGNNDIKVNDSNYRSSNSVEEIDLSNDYMNLDLKKLTSEQKKLLYAKLKI